MSDWKNGMSFLQPTCVVHRVGGVEVNFYPMPVATVFKLQKAGAAIAAAFGAVFTDTSKDYGQKSTTTKDREVEHQDVEIHAITPEMAKVRAEQKAAAWKSLFEAAVNDTTRQLLGEIIMESMKDIFKPTEKKNWPGTVTFLDETPLPVFMDMIAGVAAANQGLLAPFTGKLKTILSQLTEVAKAKVATGVTVTAAVANETPASTTPPPTTPPSPPEISG